MTHAHPAPTRREVPLAILWLGVLLAPLAWTVQELASYAITAHACFPARDPRYTLPIGRAADWHHAVQLGAILLGVAGLALALWSWRATSAAERTHPEHQAEVGEGRSRFMALAGLLVSGIFLLNLLLNAVPLFFLDGCA
ncbi:MAG: hypothetical protein IPK12_24840 [Gemmatimonadetes bacterium]|nr:hypothetical protein [Gemmatimonadota bacterium]